MLALARKVNESIVINDDVEVTILEIKGDQVRSASRRQNLSRFIEKNYIFRFRKPMKRL